MNVIKEAPKFSMRNKEQLHENCCCYACLAQFKKEEIVQWTDQHQTAICPRCEVDAVLPQELADQDTLKKVQKFWFGESKEDHGSGS